MSRRLIRIYKDLDIQEIKECLLIVGDLSAQCSKCNHLGIKLEANQCPQCSAAFQYISFRNIKDHLPKIQRLIHERPGIVLIDFDDFKRLSGALRAEEFLR